MNKMTPEQLLLGVSDKLEKHRVSFDNMTPDRITQIENLRDYVTDQLEGVFTNCLQALPSEDFLAWAQS